MPGNKLTAHKLVENVKYDLSLFIYINHDEANCLIRSSYRTKLAWSLLAVPCLKYADERLST